MPEFSELPSSSPAASGADCGPVAAIILAAGKSTRMRSKVPKPLHPLCGLPMTGHVIRACRHAEVARIVVIVGHEAETVKAGLGDGVEYALQVAQNGTGDAVRAAQSLLGDWPGTILILAGDVPLLTAETLQGLIAHHREKNASATLLTAFLEDPTGYGRIVRDSAGRVSRIVEENDATPEERAIKEWNPSLYAFQSKALWESLAHITNKNAKNEYYLTDTIGVLTAQGAPIEPLPVKEAQEVLGVNTRIQLADVARVLRERILNRLMLSGVTIVDPAATYVDVDVTVGQDTVIEPNSFLHTGTTVGEDCVIGPFARLSGSRVGNRVTVLASTITDSVLEDDARVGPYAHLRPGAHLGPKVKIGDFVEVKNAHFAAGAQASHLAYIGDAEVGEGANIGAGTITCNYDGFEKHRTVIGKRVFVGSHSTLIAPVILGDEAFIAAGSSVAEDVPAGAMAIARSRATIKEGWATAFRARRAAERAAKAAERENA